MIEIRELAGGESGIWDEVAGLSPEGTPFHVNRWLSSYDAALGINTRRLGAFEDGKLVGILPVCLNLKPREWWRTRRAPLTAASPPIRFETPYGGPVALPGRGDVVCELVKHIHHRHLAGEIAFSPDLERSHRDYPELVGTGVRITELQTYLIDLKRSEEALWSACRGNMRTHVRKARRMGVRFTAQQGSLAFTEFYSLIARTYARSGFSPLPESFYRRIIDAFGDSIWSFFAEVESGKVAVEISIVWRNRLYAWSGGSDERFWSFRPNNLMSWEIVRWARSRGLETYDLCGAGMSSIGKFKESLGGRLHTYPLLEFGRLPRAWSGLASCFGRTLNALTGLPIRR